MRLIFILVSSIVTGLWTATTFSSTSTPWGSATAQIAGYAPQKVVYDVAVSTPGELDRLFDRISALNIEYGSDPFDAAIVVVLQGPEIRFFNSRNFEEHKDLVRRAQTLTSGGVIEIRMCQRLASHLDTTPADVHGFIDMVPLGDAEIIRLQQEEGYAYIKQ